MLDITLLRKDLDAVVARLATRKSPQTFLDVERFTELESERKSIQTRTEELQAKRNSLSKQIGQLKAKGGDVAAVMAEVGGIGDELKASAERLEVIQHELGQMLMVVPNLPHESVPVGEDETANAEVRRWGSPREFDFRGEGPRRPGRAPGAGLRDRRQAGRCAIHLHARADRPAASRARAVHARRADHRAWLHRVLHALHRQPRSAGRHGAAAQIQGRHVLGAARRRRRTAPSST